jgi:hypothetical protein
MNTDIKINLDSKHLPVTAAAWQSWKIIGVVFVAGFITVTSGVAAYTAVALLNNGLPKTAEDRTRISYQRQCQAQFALANKGYRDDVGLNLCRAQAELMYPSRVD